MRTKCSLAARIARTSHRGRIGVANEKRLFFAVKAFVLHEGRFLAMHRSDSKSNWLELPGGRMEFGETAEETVVREVLEETGLVVKPVKLLDTWNTIKEDYQITGIIYSCTLQSGEVRLSTEHDRYEWLEADIQAIDRLHQVFREKMTYWNWQEVTSSTTPGEPAF